MTMSPIIVSMYSYEVWVRSQRYVGLGPLTYTSVEKLPIGTIVKVDLRKQLVLGIVRRETAAPKGVAMKPIEAAYADAKVTLPLQNVQLINWLLRYYPSGSGSITSLFLPPSWPAEIPNKQTSSSEDSALKNLVELTNDQTKALTVIRSRPGSFLLHGDTGTGKTRVYMELIRDALKEGRSSLILVPEIGLTSHLYQELSNYFPGEIIKVFHSNLTPAKRKQVWTEILASSSPLIVLGPRSALFAPLHNIGLVVVDECHDDGYKQDSSPYYHGLRVASQLAHSHNAMLIFGSATPSVVDTFIASQKEIPIIRMKEVAVRHSSDKANLKVISKQDRTEFTHSTSLSTTLINSIKEQLSQRQQSLIFLNRRGSARITACTECGWRALCPICDLPLTLHEDSFDLRCHTCGYNSPVPTQCPTCSNTEILFYGPGTKAVEKELNKLFPGVNIARFDGDNLTHERLDRHFDAIRTGEIQIIIGTQILVKGFDIPKLGLVGIVDADASLSLPDFSTEERTFQLITQAMGRVGRGHTPGTVVVQTFDPDSRTIKAITARDWVKFYDKELASRKEHHFPPFVFLLKLECTRKSRNSASLASTKLKSTLARNYGDIEILGPTPSFKEKRGRDYTWQLVIKSRRRSILLEIIASLPSGWKYDIDPTHLL